MSRRWVYQGNALRNWQRPVSPKLVVIKNITNGLVNLPIRKRGKR